MTLKGAKHKARLEHPICRQRKQNLRDMFPHYVNGGPNSAAIGDFALVYQHPDDLHLTIVYNQVSKEFIAEYLKRSWIRTAEKKGWQFHILPEVYPVIHAERTMTIQ